MRSILNGGTAGEIVRLVMNSSATLVANTGNDPTPESFHFKPRDDLGRECKLVVIIETDARTGEQIIVISAYREVNL